MKYSRFLIPYLLVACSGAPVPETTNATTADSKESEASKESLPDDYLPFVLNRDGSKLEGASEFLEGFSLSIDLPQELTGRQLDLELLMSAIRAKQVEGIVSYPNGKTTPIAFEVVKHRGDDEIYMKTSLGYFLWEMIEFRENQIAFAIYFWYCPPAKQTDLDILEMAGRLMELESNWHKEDDRKCDVDMETKKFSLFCALKHASIEKMGEYNHHNTAMQYVRFAIDELAPDHEFEHTLMDYNNAESTSHSSVVEVLTMAAEKIKKELDYGN